MSAEPLAQPPAPPTDRIGRLVARVLALPPVRWLTPILDDYGCRRRRAARVRRRIQLAVRDPAGDPAPHLAARLLLNDPLRVRQIVESRRAVPAAEQFFDRCAVAVHGPGRPRSRSSARRSRVGFEPVLPVARRRDRPDLQGQRTRPVQRGLRGVLSVVLLVGAVLAVVYLGPIIDDLGTSVPAIGQIVVVLTSTVGSILGTIVIFSIAIAVIYRIVPTPSPSWRSIGLPAMAVGLAIAVLTGIFALITPRLIGSLQVYGAFVAVFAAMIWLSYAAQAILVGAAWVHRRSVGRAVGVAAAIGGSPSPGP